MKETTLKSIEHLHKFLERFRKASQFKYRWQSDKSWELIPKAGRKEFRNVSDKTIFEHWKRRARFFEYRDNYNEWELLAVAQHTGLPTRLLDWTLNPLVGIFFATIENFEVDGAIFIYKNESRVWHEKFGPFELTLPITLYRPDTSSNRIANQYGYFTIHKDPTLALNDSNKNGYLEKLIIPADLKKQISHLLNQYGINYLTLFPDLEGLAKHLSWFAENNSYWDNTFDEDEIIGSE